MRDDEDKVDKFSNGFSWFGNMGITSNFPANNLENIALITFLMLKLSLLALFEKVFPQFTYNFFGELKCFVHIIIV